MFGKTTRCVSHSISNLLKMEFLQKSVNKKVHRRIKCYQSMRQMLDGGQPVGPSFPFKSIFAVNQFVNRRNAFPDMANDKEPIGPKDGKLPLNQRMVQDQFHLDLHSSEIFQRLKGMFCHPLAKCQCHGQLYDCSTLDHG